MNIHLTFNQCAGDTLVASGAIASLIKAKPDTKIRVSGGHSEEIYLNSRHVLGFDGEPDKTIVMENPLINESHLPWHFLHSYCVTLEKALGFPVPLITNHPIISFSNEELKEKSTVQEITGKPIPYWLICRPGAKNCYTVKRYPTEYLQDIVDYFRGRIQFIQVGEAHHNHVPLHGVINMIGKTNIRELLKIARNSKGILTGDNFLWHVAAALHKPAVGIAAAWLSKQWIEYPSQLLISKHGCLSCCRYKSCGKDRVEDLNDGDPKSKNLCELPVFGFQDVVAKCMAMITPEEVIRGIESYLS